MQIAGSTFIFNIFLPSSPHRVSPNSCLTCSVFMNITARREVVTTIGQRTRSPGLLARGIPYPRHFLSCHRRATMLQAGQRCRPFSLAHILVYIELLTVSRASFYGNNHGLAADNGTAICRSSGERGGACPFKVCTRRWARGRILRRPHLPQCRAPRRTTRPPQRQFSARLEPCV